MKNPYGLESLRRRGMRGKAAQASGQRQIWGDWAGSGPTGVWGGTGDGTRDLALKSRNSKRQGESRKVPAPGSLRHFRKCTLHVCLLTIFVRLSIYFSPLFHLPFAVPLSLVHLCVIAFTFSLLLPGFRYLFL